MSSATAEWTREELIAELRYLATSVVNQWEEDIDDSIGRVIQHFGLLDVEGGES
jgi:hypothetical protein